LVDAGIGTPSDAVIAMEMGSSGVLLNTAIAEAKNPIQMAHAFKLAVEAGRAAHLAGRMPKREMAKASSPEQGLVH
jgi:thiazole synthase